MNRFLISALHHARLIDFAINRKIGDYKPSWNRVKQDGFLPLPFYLNFILTQRCNLNCIMCHEQGNVKKLERELTTEQIFRTIENAGNIKVAAIQGGEILLRRDIWDILEFMDSRNIRLKVTTNGYAVTDEVVDKIKKLRNVENAATSIDGPEPIHNAIRRKPDAFKRTTDAVVRLKKSGLTVAVSSVLLPENINYIEETLELLLKLHVDRVSILPFTYKKKKEELMIRKMFPGQTLSLPEKEDDFHPFSAGQLLSVTQAINKFRAKGLLCSFYPPFVGKFTAAYAEEKSIPGTFVCKQFYQLLLNERGDMFPCAFLNKSFGNIHETPVEKVWNSQELRMFRQSLAKGNMLPICRRCCGLYRA
jgi:AdoMet-dependent heme synthase